MKQNNTVKIGVFFLCMGVCAVFLTGCDPMKSFFKIISGAVQGGLDALVGEVDGAIGDAKKSVDNVLDTGKKLVTEPLNEIKTSVGNLVPGSDDDEVQAGPRPVAKDGIPKEKLEAFKGAFSDLQKRDPSLARFDFSNMTDSKKTVTEIEKSLKDVEKLRNQMNMYNSMKNGIKEGIPSGLDKFFPDDFKQKRFDTPTREKTIETPVKKPVVTKPTVPAKGTPAMTLENQKNYADAVKKKISDALRNQDITEGQAEMEIERIMNGTVTGFPENQRPVRDPQLLKELEVHNKKLYEDLVEKNNKKQTNETLVKTEKDPSTAENPLTPEIRQELSKTIENNKAEIVRLKKMKDLPENSQKIAKINLQINAAEKRIEKAIKDLNSSR